MELLLSLAFYQYLLVDLLILTVWWSDINTDS